MWSLVAELLAGRGLQPAGHRKTREGPQHPDRDAQFRYIHQQDRRFQAASQPVVSVDTKKRELIEHGLFAHISSNWRGWPLASLAVLRLAEQMAGKTIRAWPTLKGRRVGISASRPTHEPA
jgi:hypothetical protein